jgi:hypothetical protein
MKSSGIFKLLKTVKSKIQNGKDGIHEGHKDREMALIPSAQAE